MEIYKKWLQLEMLCDVMWSLVTRRVFFTSSVALTLCTCSTVQYSTVPTSLPISFALPPSHWFLFPQCFPILNFAESPPPPTLHLHYCLEKRKYR